MDKNGPVPWPSWEQAGVACLVSVIAWLVLRWLPPSRVGDAILPAFREFALISGLYGIWRLARMLPITHESGALDRAREIDHLQRLLHLPTEISMQHFVVNHDWLARFVNAYYAIVHVPALIAFLVWAFVRHRDLYPHWRNGLVAVTAGCLLIRFIRVAPPRFVDELGFVDLSSRFGLGVYGDVGTGVSDQFAAMPSIHVGWAAVVALGTFAMASGWWRWLVLLHLPVTVFVVAATGHHWWLDGIVAVALMAAGLVIDSRVRGRRAARRTSEVTVEV
ncbi:inositol phosphorylceramide synthase [Aeromicrobium yanjiei]|uniref:Inositol phosphorylceramide synthase n=1 Tax=Aeromicrobium yanjiei TaxID=2662028 RepID=A0A5Q2MI29_9ACTN|nr:inositol phosphorylceramide synthase [Aeromicrobium sp. S22]QGG41411.1 inositol phosphorylceramide synthase [Aeromicrobium yanjiei]